MMRKTLSAAVVLLILVFAITGCSEWNIFNSDEPEFEPISTRYHFSDILIPADLDIDEKDSFVFESGDIKAGTLFYAGYVEIESLINFFLEGMPQDGWTLKSIFRYPRSMLLFEKPEKVCIIQVYESALLTRAEIWVAPVK